MILSGGPPTKVKEESHPIIRENKKKETNSVEKKSSAKIEQSTEVQTRTKQLSAAVQQDKKVYCMESDVDACRESIKEKEQVADLETPLQDARSVAGDLERVKEHSKAQSRAMLKVKQELDATKVFIILY